MARFIHFVSMFTEGKTGKPCAEVEFSDGRKVRLYLGEVVAGSTAAPGLLAALDGLVNAYESWPDQMQNRVLAHAAYSEHNLPFDVNAARAALAKAEGR